MSGSDAIETAAALPDTGTRPTASVTPAVPSYLSKTYWWAYVHPNAVKTFERDWLVNLILFGNYARLRDAAVADLGEPIRGRVLQLACVYGDLTRRIVGHLDAEAQLDVVDILPIQLANLAQKVPKDPRVAFLQGDSTALACPDASYDQVLLFFLLHEQPEAARRATLAEALRVVRPGGRIVIVDYHPPRRWNPLRWLMRVVFATLEPYAIDLWRQPLDAFLPASPTVEIRDRRTYFFGLYQKIVLRR
jgi:ubiquinone/menaquinone biosynthesis C-methylase UbiE